VHDLETLSSSSDPIVLGAETDNWPGTSPLQQMARTLVLEPGVRTQGRLVRALVTVAISGAMASWGPSIHADDQPTRPTFSTRVDLVSVTAVVRDERGRPVRNLAREDFEIFERGRQRRIVDFKASDQGPVSLAILFDVSGSMRVGAQMEAGRRAVEHLLGWIEPARDELGLFSFDRELRQDVAFTSDPQRIRAGLNRLTAVGQTSLYDAIAETSKALADRPSPRRAVVVITDGVDTSSALTPSQVSGLASAIDVPVYVIAVVSPLDHPGAALAVVDEAESPVTTHLSKLAYWTGGDLAIVSAPAHASQAARAVIAELRHQYLIAFEAAKEPGWYELDVRTRRRELTVRARSGYFSQSARPS
jgi:Ca-activated chloride channel family protein